MGAEIEVKVQVSPEELLITRRRALELGFRPVHPRAREENCLFDLPDRRLTEQGCALRLRQYGERSLLTYKGPRKDDPRFKIREEIETPIGDYAAALRLLEALGFLVTFRYSKVRERFRGPEPGVELCLDETPFGCFVEIEGPPEVLTQVASALGWSPADFITRNYVDLYLEHGRGQPT